MIMTKRTGKTEEKVYGNYLFIYLCNFIFIFKNSSLFFIITLKRAFTTGDNLNIVHVTVLNMRSHVFW